MSTVKKRFYLLNHLGTGDGRRGASDPDAAFHILTEADEAILTESDEFIDIEH